MLTYSSQLCDLSISCISQRGTGHLLCEQLIEEKPTSFVSEREGMTKNASPPTPSPAEWEEGRKGGGEWESPPGDEGRRKRTSLKIFQVEVQIINLA